MSESKRGDAEQERQKEVAESTGSRGDKIRGDVETGRDVEDEEKAKQEKTIRERRGSS